MIFERDHACSASAEFWERALGRVVFTPKAEPTVDWSEFESRLQDISTPSPQSSDLRVEPSVTLANDPVPLNDEAVTASSDPLDILSLLTAIPSNGS
jgi:hypothetical protein